MKAFGIFGFTFVALILVSLSGRAEILSASVFSGQNNNELKFDEQLLAYSQIINARFTKSSFTLSQWQQISVKNSEWKDSKLSGVRINKSTLESVQFLDTDLSGLKCFNCTIKNSVFENSRLDGARFFAGRLENIHFKNSNLSRVDFVGTSLVNCTLDKATAKSVHPNLLKKWKLTVKELP